MRGSNRSAVFLSLVIAIAEAALSPDELQALRDIYAATSGQKWFNAGGWGISYHWDSDTEPCSSRTTEWYGVVCNDAGTSVMYAPVTALFNCRLSILLASS